MTPRARFLTVVLALSLFVFGSPARAVTQTTVAGSWGTNGTVYSVTRIGDLLVIGGDFSAVVSPSGATRAARNLAALRASTGAWAWSAKAGGAVFRVQSDGTSIWVGGSAGVEHFSATGRRLAFRAPHDVGTVRALAVGSGRVYYGGTQGLAAATASGDPLWRATTTALSAGGVRALTMAATANGTRLMAGGHFCTVNGADRPGMVSLHLDGRVDPGFRAPAFTCGSGTGARTPFDFAASGSRVYVAGGGRPNTLVAVAASTGATIWSRQANGDYQTVAVQGGAVYAGGHFTKVCVPGDCTVARVKAAKYSTAGTLDPNWKPTLGPVTQEYFAGVWSMRGDSGGLYSGGVFQHVNGAPRRSVAIFS